MDHPTLVYYNTHAPELAARYERVSSIAAMHFDTTFAKAGKILDIGCGSGRDLALLANQSVGTY